MANEFVESLKNHMQKSVDSFQHEISVIRTGRANASMLDLVKVEYYGFPTPLNEIAQIMIPEPRQLMIKPYERESLSLIEKAIRDSNLGLVPNNDGTCIRLNIPALTEERRKELTKVASGYAEQTKVSVRNIRRDGMEAVKSMEKEKQISEDDRKSYEEEIQKLTDAFVADIDKHFAEKQKDIMTI